MRIGGRIRLVQVRQHVRRRRLRHIDNNNLRYSSHISNYNNNNSLNNNNNNKNDNNNNYSINNNNNSINNTSYVEVWLTMCCVTNSGR